MSQNAITDQRHNEYVGSDANAGRIPGAENATTGHHFISVFPKGASASRLSHQPWSDLSWFSVEGAPKQSNAERRPEEHLPGPTGRTFPPKGADRGRFSPYTASATHTDHAFQPPQNNGANASPQTAQRNPLRLRSIPAPSSIPTPSPSGRRLLTR